MTAPEHPFKPWLDRFREHLGLSKSEPVACEHTHRHHVQSFGSGEVVATISGVDICADCGALVMAFDGPPPPMPTKAQIDRMVDALPNHHDEGWHGCVQLEPNGEPVGREEIRRGLYRAAGIGEGT